MSDGQLSRTSAGLGVMALALLLVGPVVQQARAATVCEACLYWAGQQGIYECKDKGYLDQDGNPIGGQKEAALCRGIRRGWQNWCYSSQNGQKAKCPDSSLPSGKVSCGSEDCKMVRDNSSCSKMMKERGGGSTCNESCGGYPCSDPVQSGTSGNTFR